MLICLFMVEDYSPNDEVLGIRNDHHPLLGWSIPDYLWIPELCAVDGYNGVVGVLRKGITSVSRVSNLVPSG